MSEQIPRTRIPEKEAKAENIARVHLDSLW